MYWNILLKYFCPSAIVGSVFHRYCSAGFAGVPTGESCNQMVRLFFALVQAM
jgi:hypothetical protein